MFPVVTHCRTALMNCIFLMERVTGTEPASRACEPYDDALVRALTRGPAVVRTDPGRTVVDLVLWHAYGTAAGTG
jgi:hypothetical protein